jgi:predicted acetyltransferase
MMAIVDVNLTPVAEEDKATLANLIQLYRYDSSDLRGYELTRHGTFVYRYLDHYFVEAGREACFIRAGAALAGFTMTRALADGEREVAEFFVVRRHRRGGVGRAAAHLMFRRHPGRWILAFDHHNRPAAGFWPGTVAAIADGEISSENRFPPDSSYPGTWLRFRVSGAWASGRAG